VNAGQILDRRNAPLGVIEMRGPSVRRSDGEVRRMLVALLLSKYRVAIVRNS